MAKNTDPVQNLDLIGPRDRLTLLENLEHHAGFHLFIREWEKRVHSSLTDRILDVATTDGETRILKESRARLVEGFAPLKVVQSAIVAAKSEALREERERK